MVYKEVVERVGRKTRAAGSKSSLFGLCLLELISGLQKRISVRDFDIEMCQQE